MTDTVVVGAGQAGLAVARELSKHGVKHLVIDAATRIGESWRARWDSLTAFTPAEHDGLPDVPFPGAKGTFPSKDEIAGYLEDYAGNAGILVRLAERATRLASDGDRWMLETDRGRISARRAVIATGTNAVPSLPAFALDLAPGIRQLHSAEYRNPDLVPPGEVLVVGAGTSGAEIALELARSGSHRVVIAGRPTAHVPDLILNRAGSLYWWLVDSVLTRDTPPGRRAAAAFHSRGAPLIRISIRQLQNVGVEQLPRVDRVEDGAPVLSDGRRVDPGTVIWATGYRPNYEWIAGLATDADGWPLHIRGVSPSSPGLYFVGIPFQHALTSGLLGGVGRDARYVAERIAGL